MSSSTYSEQPRLVYFSPEPDREGHASFTHVHEIINNLREIGWNVNYFSPYYETANLPSPLQRLSRITHSLVRAMACRRPNTVYMRWHFASFPLSLWARIRNIPVVIEVNGPVNDLFIAWPSTRKFERIFTWLMKIQLRWAAGIVAVTDGLADLCRDMTDCDKIIEVIPNGANTEHFHPDAANKPHNLDDLPNSFCLFFGTMAPWQGIDDLLAAVASTDWPSDFPLLIAGDGERRLQAEAAAAKYPSKLRYLGRLPYNELPKLVARSQCTFVCTQNLDGRANSGMAPLKLFESLACATPVIATRMPFQEDIVRDSQAGFLVDEGHPSQIVSAVTQLARDKVKTVEMGIKGRKFVYMHHSWRARAEKTHQLLLRILRTQK